MKKLLSLLLVGTLAAATQAVTIDWSKVSGANSVTTSAKTAGSAQMTVAAKTAWTASCLLTISLPRAFTDGNYYPSLFGVATASNSKTSWRFNANFGTSGTGPGTIGTYNNDANGTLVGTAKTLTAGEYEFTLSFNGTDTLSFYIDGTLYATANNWAGGANPYLVWGQQAPKATNQALVSGADYTTKINYVAGKTYTELTVPEPTVLALLALGVAGLALRRKA